MKLIRTNENEYRIEGLKDFQVVLIYEALKAVPKASIENEVLVTCIMMDYNKINKKD